MGYLLHGLWDVLHETHAHSGVDLFGPQQITEIPLAYGAIHRPPTPYSEIPGHHPNHPEPTSPQLRSGDKVLVPLYSLHDKRPSRRCRVPVLREPSGDRGVLQCE